MSWFRDCIEWRQQLAAFRRGNVAATALNDHVLLFTSDNDRSVAALFNTGHQVERHDIAEHTTIREPIRVPARTAMVVGL